MTEKIGLQAVWDNTNFIKGQNEYMKKMLEAQGATTKTASSMSSMGSSGGGLGGMLSNISGALGVSVGGLAALAGGLVIAKGAFDLVSGAVSSFASFMFKGADSALMVASRVEQLNLIAQTLAQSQGMAGEAVNELVASLNKQGISLGVSNYLVAQFSRMQLDLSKSTDIARVAQDAATISNEGSSDALEGLIYGIQTLNIRILRTHGIMVDSDAAYKLYAEANKIAGRELSATEKQQAMLNAVIAAGTSIAGAYEASMLTAGKQLGSMTSRVLPDLKAALGAPFQAGFFNMIKGFNDVLDGLRAMTIEGGVLYPMMVQLGALFQVITEPIKNFGAMLKEGGSGGLADFASNIMTYISNAYSWGLNLVTNFAVGMINGASSAITQAINYISSMLSGWFAPGSPPAIAPDIDVWGSETMDEYLDGFAEADFNILKNIQQPMKNVFSSLAGMGDISAQAASEMYASFSEAFITAMANGTVTQELFDQLAGAGGVYGDELASIAAKQYELLIASDLLTVAQEGLTAAKAAGAAALKVADEEAEAAKNKYDQTVLEGDAAIKVADEAAEKAREKYDATVLAGEKAIEAATKKRDVASSKVTKGLQEYNQMLRGGASKEQLAIKLKEINANKAIQRSAEEEIALTTEANKIAEETGKAEVDAAEEARKTVQEKADAAQEAAKAEVDAAEKHAKIVKENSDAVIAAEQAKVDAAKENLKVLQDQEALLEMQLQTMIDLNKAQEEAWRIAHQPAPLTPVVPTAPGGGAPGGGGLPTPEEPKPIDPNAIVNTMRDAVNAAAEDMKTRMFVAWFTIKRHVITAWNEAMWNIKNAISGSGLGEKWEEIKKKASDTWQGIKKEVSDVIFFLKRWWSQYGGDIVGFFQGSWDKLKIIFKFFKPFISLIFKSLFADIKVIVGVGWTLIKGIFKIAMTIIGGLFRFFGKLLKGDWKGAWDAIKDTLSKVWKIIKSTLAEAQEKFYAYFKEKLDNIKEFWAETWGKVVTKLKEKWAEIKKEIEEKIEAAKKKIGDVSDDIKKAWEKFWDAVSKKVTEIWDAVKKYIGDKIDEAALKIKTVSDDIKLKWTTFWDAVKTKVTEIWDAVNLYIATKIDEAALKIKTVSDDIKLKWTTFWDSVKTKVTEIWDAVKLYIATKIDEVALKIKTISDDIKLKWDTFWDAVKTKATEVWDGENGIKTRILTALDKIKAWIGSTEDGTGFLGTVMTRWTTAWNNFKTKVIGIWDGEDGIKTKVQAAVDWFKDLWTNSSGTGLIDKISTWATDVYNKFKTLGANVANGIKDGIVAGWKNLSGGLSGLVASILAIIKKLLGITSPSKVMKNLGGQMMKGLDIGIRAHAILPKNAMMDTMLPVANMANIPITQGANNYYQPNINMTNNINNGMSVPYLQAMIIRTVKKGMTA